MEGAFRRINEQRRAKAAQKTACMVSNYAIGHCKLIKLSVYPE